MIDRWFSAALTLGLLVAATCAIAAALFGLDAPPRAAARTSATRVVELPPVVVVGHRPTTTLAQRDASGVPGVRLQ